MLMVQVHVLMTIRTFTAMHSTPKRHLHYQYEIHAPIKACWPILGSRPGQLTQTVKHTLKQKLRPLSMMLTSIANNATNVRSSTAIVAWHACTAPVCGSFGAVRPQLCEQLISLPHQLGCFVLLSSKPGILSRSREQIPTKATMQHQQVPRAETGRSLAYRIGSSTLD